jgi:hypothetical protein
MVFGVFLFCVNSFEHFAGLASLIFDGRTFLNDPDTFGIV